MPSDSPLSAAPSATGEEARHPQRPAQPNAAIQRLTFARSAEALLIVDANYLITDANPALDRLLGREAGATQGQRCLDALRCRDRRGALLCGSSACPLDTTLAAANDTQGFHDITWETQDGRQRAVSASFTADAHVSGRHVWIIARDVTAASAVNHVQANFISMISHELRTPLNTLNGFLEIVLEEQAGPLNTRQVEFLGYARTSAHQLATLVEDILLISKADAGQFTLRLEKMDGAKVARLALQAVGAAARKGEITIETRFKAERAPMIADALRVQQVLTNLLLNAVKFSPPASIVQLLVNVSLEETRFSVTDAGVGIPLDDQARIFERFYQSAASAQEHPGGYGLGLAIAKMIVEEHGGRIWVESRSGAGATFHFTIPTRPAKRSAPHRAAEVATKIARADPGVKGADS